MNTAIKSALFERETTQIEIAKKVGIHESRLSKIVRGHVDPSDDEKKLIAKALRKPVAHLFPEVAA